MKILSIPFISGYLYLLTVVTYYGWNSYFNIPANYIEFSPLNPVIFFFDLARLMLQAAARLSIGIWVLLGITVVVLFLIYHSGWLGRWAVLLGLIGFVIYLPFGFNRFGATLAASATNFYSAPSSCIPGATEALYIAPTLYGGKAVFVPVSTSTRQLMNGLLVRETSDLMCELQKTEVGKVSK